MGASRRAGPRSRRRSGSLGLPAALMVALSPGACMPALQAQQSADVNFSPGKYGTMLSGSVTGREYFDHKLRARAGQKMLAELSIRRSNDSHFQFQDQLHQQRHGLFQCDASRQHR